MTVQRDRGLAALYVHGDRGAPNTVAQSLERAADRLAVTTASGDVSLDRLADADVDVDCLVTDHDPPSHDAVKFIETVRRNHPHLPVVVFTPRGSESIASRALGAGATDYLPQTDDPDEYARLAARIEAAVEQARTRREHRRNDRRFRAISDDPELALAVLAPDGTIRTVNHAAAELAETPPGDLTDVPFREAPWWTERQRSDVRQQVDRAADGEYVTVEADRSARDELDHANNPDYTDPDHTGDWRHVRGVIRPVTDADGDVVSLVASLRDVTDCVETRRALKEQSDLLDSVFEQVPIHMYIKDREARYVRVSKEYVENTDTGPSTEEHIGKTDLELYPEEFAREAYEDDMRVIETGEPLVDKEEYEPRSEVWNLTTKVPMYDEDGDVRGLIGVTRWITERKEYEQQLKRQNERLDDFASILSHDLRNPLNVALGRTRMAAAECDSDHLDSVMTALERMERLVTDLLAVARDGAQVGDPEPLDLAEIVERSWQTVPTSEATLDVETTRTLRADPDRLQQLLENLLRNAIDHGGEDVTVTVGALEDGFYVADDGPGIPEDERESVFDSHYSTADDSTGIGLTIVDQIADGHGWDVIVTDSADDGVSDEDGESEARETASPGARFEITGVEVDE